MSGPFGAGALNLFSGAAEFYPYTIDQSVRFNDNDSAYLEKTFSGTGNRRTFTISFWFKRCRDDTAEYLFAGGDDTSNRFHMDINASGTFQIEAKSGGSTQIKMEGGPVLRDLGAWYHFVLRVDTTQGTASDRVRLYVNGDLLTFNSNTYPSQNADLNWNLNDQVRIGRAGWATNYFDGYFAEFINVDGQSLAPTSFGETKAGIWVPIEYTGSYGTNGFKLAFQDSASLGDDTSGNGNDFTSSGLASNDQMPSSPTNNFATLNPLDAGSNVTLSNGNLVFASSAADGGCRSTINFAGDKYYVEAIVGTHDGISFGIANKNRSLSADAGEDLNDFYGWYLNPLHNWIADGTNPWNTGSSSSSGSLDVMQMFVDASDPDSIKVFAGVNNTYYDSSGGTTANPSTGANPTATITDGEEWAIGLWNRNNTSSNFVVNFGQDSSFAGNKTAAGNTDANGIGDFFYSVPTDGKALCAANLPTPGIDPAADESPTDYFNTVLYTGDGSTSNAISGVGFSPNWVWIKKRGPTAASNRLLDTVRGVQKNLYSDATTAEETQNSIMSFDSDGFTLGDSNGTNQSTHTFVSWNWKAGGTAVSNTDGTITSSVSASPESGFSIVSYTGTGANATVGHGLPTAPKVLIVKNRDTAGKFWPVYHSGLGGAYFVYLNATDATQTATNAWNATEPTSSVFSIGTSGNTNASGDGYIAYCFTDIDGMVKAGSYTGNGSSDGPFIYTGFRPAWVMVKRTDVANDWHIVDAARDPFNLADDRLKANTSDAEASDSNYGFDFVSNGFKVGPTAQFYDASGGTYIYLAFAEQPFKYANAR